MFVEDELCFCLGEEVGLLGLMLQRLARSGGFRDWGEVSWLHGSDRSHGKHLGRVLPFDLLHPAPMPLPVSFCSHKAASDSMLLVCAFSGLVNVSAGIGCWSWWRSRRRAAAVPLVRRWHQRLPLVAEEQQQEGEPRPVTRVRERQLRGTARRQATGVWVWTS